MPSLLFYLLGVSSLFAADLIVTRAFPAETIAAWAETRALVGISGVLCLVGLDQVLVRSPQSSRRLLLLLAIQIPLLSLVVGYLIRELGFLASWPVASAIALGSAGSIALFQYFRSHHKRLKSQLAQQTWKVLALAVVGITAVSTVALQPDYAVAAVLLGSVATVSMFLWRDRPATLHVQAPEGTSALYTIGSRFMATSLMLALTVHAEQLVVKGLGTTSESALYFTHATYFLFPGSLIIGYCAFLIGPWIRDNHDSYVTTLQKRWIAIVVGALLHAVVLNGIGWGAWVIIRPVAGAPDPWLQVLFLVGTLANSLYVLPSAYNGVHGRPRQHDALIAGQIASLIVASGVILTAVHTSPMALVYAVALASTLNRLLRTAVGFGVSHVIITSRG